MMMGLLCASLDAIRCPAYNEHMATKSETIVFNGIKFRRYPDAKASSDRRYYVPGIHHRQRGIGRLHVEIWKSVNGPVPEGKEIHHKDGNFLNNDPSNLVCLTPEEHDEWHRQHPPAMTAEWLARLEAIRPLASEWHASEEGREWHRRHGAATFGNPSVRSLSCEYCGKDFETRKAGKTRFCSNNCRSGSRRAAGVDQDARSCAWCNVGFYTNRYSPARTCSRSCTARLWRAEKRLAAEKD